MPHEFGRLEWKSPARFVVHNCVRFMPDPPPDRLHLSRISESLRTLNFCHASYIASMRNGETGSEGVLKWARSSWRVLRGIVASWDGATELALGFRYASKTGRMVSLERSNPFQRQAIQCGIAETNSGIFRTQKWAINRAGAFHSNFPTHGVFEALSQSSNLMPTPTPMSTLTPSFTLSDIMQASVFFDSLVTCLFYILQPTLTTCYMCGN